MSTRPGLLKSLWRKIREPLARSRVPKTLLAALFEKSLRFVDRTNRRVSGFDRLAELSAPFEPAIFALWHGQHILAPFVYDSPRPAVAMVSRSNDAELNAMVLERLGIEAARGSGGRDRVYNPDKGGARALITLKKALDAGKNVVMIADIPKGRPRDAGLGIVTLARISGRPIVPVALATSRRKVLERSWDKTTISLPFGRAAIVVGDPISVPADADEKAMEGGRRAVTDGLNAATAKAYQLVDGAR